MLDGKIAVPDNQGITHIDRLSEALRQRRAEQLAYFAFDLLHLDGHDLRQCAIEDRKALLRDVVGAAECPRLVAVDHIVGSGLQLFAAVRQLGAEGIVSKRAGSPFRSGAGRDWLKTKVSETGAFVITGFVGREAVAVAEMQGGVLVPAGLVKFGLAARICGYGRLRVGPETRSGLVPVRPEPTPGSSISDVTAPAGSATVCCCRSAERRRFHHPWARGPQGDAVGNPLERYANAAIRW